MLNVELNVLFQVYGHLLDSIVILFIYDASGERKAFTIIMFFSRYIGVNYMLPCNVVDLMKRIVHKK